MEAFFLKVETLSNKKLGIKLIWELMLTPMVHPLNGDRPKTTQKKALPNGRHLKKTQNILSLLKENL